MNSFNTPALRSASAALTDLMGQHAQLRNKLLCHLASVVQELEPESNELLFTNYGGGPVLRQERPNKQTIIGLALRPFEGHMTEYAIAHNPAQLHHRYQGRYYVRQTVLTDQELLDVVAMVNEIYNDTQVS